VVEAEAAGDAFDLELKLSKITSMNTLLVWVFWLKRQIGIIFLADFT
jgi:hypothetical protein